MSDSVKLSLGKFKIGKLPIMRPIFSWALDNYAQSLKDEYDYGDINYDDLYITVLDSYIQDVVKNNLETDIIIFDNVQLKNGKFIISDIFNQENADAMAIQNAIDELKRIITDEDLKLEVSDVLDENNETEMQFKEDFDEIIDLLKTKIESDDLADLSNEEEVLFTSLSNNFSEMDDTKKNEVSEAIEGNMDSTIVSNLNESLSNLGISGYNNITDLLIGVGE